MQQNNTNNSNSDKFRKSYKLIIGAVVFIMLIPVVLCLIPGL